MMNHSGRTGNTAHPHQHPGDSLTKMPFLLSWLRKLQSHQGGNLEGDPKNR